MASWLKIGRFNSWPGMGASGWKRGIKVFLKRVCAGTDSDGAKLPRYFVEYAGPRSRAHPFNRRGYYIR